MRGSQTPMEYQSLSDKVSAETRSRIMASVRSKGTRPEMVVRRMLHRLGYRYRLHRSDLPGTPDLVFPSRNKVVFVNGCFWHSHSDCPRTRVPATNRGYWESKLDSNRKRDAKNVELLTKKGWSVATVWECQLRNLERTENQLVSFLEEC